jgi:hypothetical protein
MLLRRSTQHSFQLEEALFIALVKPTKHLTHISHLLGFHEGSKQLPQCFLAFDNLEITL